MVAHVVAHVVAHMVAYTRRAAVRRQTVLVLPAVLLMIAAPGTGCAATISGRPGAPGNVPQDRDPSDE